MGIYFFNVRSYLGEECKSSFLLLLSQYFQLQKSHTCSFSYILRGNHPQKIYTELFCGVINAELVMTARDKGKVTNKLFILFLDFIVPWRGWWQEAWDTEWSQNAKDPDLFWTQPCGLPCCKFPTKTSVAVDTKSSQLSRCNFWKPRRIPTFLEELRFNFHMNSMRECRKHHCSLLASCIHDSRCYGLHTAPPVMLL